MRVPSSSSWLICTGEPVSVTRRMSPPERCTTARPACTTSVPCTRRTSPVRTHGPSSVTEQSLVLDSTSSGWLRSEVRPATPPANASADRAPSSSASGRTGSTGRDIADLDVRREPDALAVEQRLHALAAEYRTGLRDRDLAGRGRTVGFREDIQLLGGHRRLARAAGPGFRGDATLEAEFFAIGAHPAVRRPHDPTRFARRRLAVGRRGGDIEDRRGHAHGAVARVAFQAWRAQREGFAALLVEHDDFEILQDVI